MPNPSSNIGFALTVGFIVYITVRGELPAYLCVVGIGSGCPTPPATVNASSSNSSTSSTVNNSSTTVISNPGTTSTTITSPPSGGNVTSTTNGFPTVTTTIGTPGGGALGGTDTEYCDAVGDTDLQTCAIYNLTSGYNVYEGTGGDDGTGEGGDNGAGDYE